MPRIMVQRCGNPHSLWLSNMDREPKKSVTHADKTSLKNVRLVINLSLSPILTRNAATNADNQGGKKRTMNAMNPMLRPKKTAKATSGRDVTKTSTEQNVVHVTSGQPYVQDAIASTQAETPPKAMKKETRKQGTNKKRKMQKVQTSQMKKMKLRLEKVTEPGKPGNVLEIISTHPTKKTSETIGAQLDIKI